MSRSRIVIIIGDGQLQHLYSENDDVDVLLLDADSDDNGTELIDNERYWAGILEPDIDASRINRIFEEHSLNHTPSNNGQPGHA